MSQRAADGEIAVRSTVQELLGVAAPKVLYTAPSRHGRECTLQHKAYSIVVPKEFPDGFSPDLCGWYRGRINIGLSSHGCVFASVRAEDLFFISYKNEKYKL